MKKQPVSKGRLLLVLLFLFSLCTVQAQKSISPDQIQDRLEVKLADMNDQLAQGTVDNYDVKIAETFTVIVLKQLEVGNSTNNALEVAQKVAQQKYPEFSDKILLIKNEIAATIKE